MDRVRNWAGVLLAIALSACAAPPAEKGLLPEFSARAEGKIKSAFEPRLSVVRDLAGDIEALCALPSANKPLQPVFEEALKVNRDFFGLNIVLEPEGIAACGREVIRPDPGFDGHDLYAAYYFSAGAEVRAQSQRRDPAILASWYDPLIASPGTRMLAPGQYPLAGKDTATISSATTLQIGGRAIGVVSLDSAYADLIADLAFAEFRSGRGGIYLIDDRDNWVIAPFSSDIGFVITDTRTGAVYSGLSRAYATYRQSQDGRIWQANADGLAFRFSPLRLNGQDRVWTLVVALPETALAKS